MDTPWCGQCTRATRQLDTPDGPQRCPACHPLGREHLGQYRTCPRCLALIRTWDREPCETHKPIPERERSSS